MNAKRSQAVTDWYSRHTPNGRLAMTLTTLTKERCKAEVPNAYSVTFHRCTFRAVKDGYCMKHHPDSVAERQKKATERYELERQRRNAPFAKLAELTAERDALLRDNKELMEALGDFIRWCDKNDWGTMPKKIETQARALLAKHSTEKEQS